MSFSKGVVCGGGRKRHRTDTGRMEGWLDYGIGIGVIMAHCWRKGAKC